MAAARKLEQKARCATLLLAGQARFLLLPFLAQRKDMLAAFAGVHPVQPDFSTFIHDHDHFAGVRILACDYGWGPGLLKSQLSSPGMDDGSRNLVNVPSNGRAPSQQQHDRIDESKRRGRWKKVLWRTGSFSLLQLGRTRIRPSENWPGYIAASSHHNHTLPTNSS